MRKRFDRSAPDYLHYGRGFPWRSDHSERLRLMASATAVAWTEPDTLCDPACGDGSVVRYAYQLHPFSSAILGDMNERELSLIPDMPCPVTIHNASLFSTLNKIGQVDTVILTEILEHLEDPDLALRKAIRHSRWLVASSPIIPEGVEDPTPEHLWGFDMDGYRQMIENAGWTPMARSEMRVLEHPYNFQIWIARAP